MIFKKNTVDLRRMRRAAVGGEAANEGYRTQSSRFLSRCFFLTAKNKLLK